MRILALPLLLCFMVCFSLVSCTDNGPAGPIAQNFTGILVASADCTLLGGDTTDFFPRPVLHAYEMPANYSLIAACPNPVVGDTTYIKFQISLPDSVTIQALAAPEATPVAEILRQRLERGFYRVMWVFSGPHGIYRVRMTTQRGFSSYGDVQFE